MTENKAQGVSNAFLLSKQLISRLRSAVTRGKDPIDKLCSDRDLVERVVAQTYPMLKLTPVYYKQVPVEGQTYKWFNTSHCDLIRDDESIVDKGRFVDACIIAYLFGPEGLTKWCVSSRIVYPKQLEDEKLARIAKRAAEIAVTKCVDSKFIPGTEPIVE